jgi:hypothetical protein
MPKTGVGEKLRWCAVVVAVALTAVAVPTYGAQRMVMGELFTSVT